MTRKEEIDFAYREGYKSGLADATFKLIAKLKEDEKNDRCQQLPKLLKQKVYWLEIVDIVYGVKKYEIVEGYCLSSYELLNDVIFIVTRSITSCVVRHIKSEYLFQDKKLAEDKLKTL